MSQGIRFDYYLNFIYFIILTLENSVGIQERNPNVVELNREISVRAGVKKSYTKHDGQILQLCSPSLMAVPAL